MQYKSDTLLQLVAPIDEKAGTPISTGTCTGRLFDDAADALLTADAVSTDDELAVDKPNRFEVGVDSVAVELDDGSIFEAGLVTAVDAAAKTVTVTTALTGDAVKGSRVMVKLGADLTLTAYGTPDVDTKTWGFDATVQSDHAGLRPGRAVRAEIELDSSGLVTLEAVRDRVTVGA